MTGNLVNSLYVTFTKSVIINIFLYLCECDKWDYRILSIFNCCSLIFASLGVIEMFNPLLIKEINSIILPDDAYSFFLTTMNRDIYVGVAPQTSYQAHFILPMLAFSFSSLIISEKARVKYAVCLIICVIAMIITAKRMPLASTIIAMIVVTLCGLMFKKEKKGRILFISIIAFLLLLFVLINTSMGTYLVDRFSRTEGIDINRMQFWSSALQMWRRNPLFGMGTNYYSQNSTASVHNTFLQILCENGLVGLLIFVLMMMIPLIKTFAMIRESERKVLNSSINMLLFTSLFYQVFYICHAFTESVYANNIMFLPYMIYVAIPYSVDQYHIVTVEAQ